MHSTTRGGLDRRFIPYLLSDVVSSDEIRRIVLPAYEQRTTTHLQMPRQKEIVLAYDMRRCAYGVSGVASSPGDGRDGDAGAAPSLAAPRDVVSRCILLRHDECEFMAGDSRFTFFLQFLMLCFNFRWKSVISLSLPGDDLSSNASGFETIDRAARMRALARTHVDDVGMISCVHARF